MAVAIPMMAVAIPTGPQTWKIICTVYIQQEGKADRTANTDEVQVQLSKQLLGSNPVVGVKKTDQYGNVTFDGDLTNGEYVFWVKHLASGAEAVGSILCPAAGNWSYHTGDDWYNPPDQMESSYTTVS